MSQMFEMKLRPDPFHRICSGEKTIEYRLHDEKRSLLNKGDYIQFTEISKVVYCFLLSLSGNESVSEELTQETMFRAIMNINSFRGDSKLSVWLCQIAKNLYYEWRKKNKRFVPMEESLDRCDSRGDFADELADKDAADQILRCLHELEEPYKEVFTLHVLGDIPLKRISQLFGKSDSWARVTYYRAKARIAAGLEEGKNEKN